MGKTVYTITRGVNKSIRFKGLQAQYVWYAAGVVIGTLALYAILFFSGINSYLCVPVALGAGAMLIGQVYKLSRKYGEFGLLKKRAAKRIPTALVSPSRKFFIQLFTDHAG